MNNIFVGNGSREIQPIYPAAERARGKRIWELDFLRGFTIILMCIDHMMFDLAAIFQKAWAAKGGAAALIAKFARLWWSHDASWIGATRDVVQIIALCVFFGLCGGSTIFSRDNLTRAMKTMIAAAVITLGTYLAASLDIIEEADVITFGVLHMLSFATLIVAGVYKLTRLAKEKGDLVFFAVSVLLAGLVFLLDYLLGRMDLTPDRSLMWLHEGFTQPAWNGGDYFPLLPYLGYAFGGAAVVTLFYSVGKSRMPRLDASWNIPFLAAGKHTLLIVVLHQVVFMLGLALVTATFVDWGNFVIF